LVDTDPSLGFQYWIESDEIRWAKLHIGTNKDKSGRIDTSLDSICEALLFVMDSSNYPVYVHCNQGKHRTGCVIACLRKVQGWSIDEAIKEYNVYAGEKSRPGDRALIKSFDPNAVFEYAKRSGILDGLSKSICGRQNRVLRHDSTIADIDALRTALEAGLLGDMELERTNSSGSSSETPSPPPATHAPVVRLPNPNGRAKGNGVEMKTTEYVEDIGMFGREVHVGEEGPMTDGVDGELYGAPLTRP
jgi:tyrosine-protein phosphatase SIW14